MIQNKLLLSATDSVINVWNTSSSSSFNYSLVKSLTGHTRSILSLQVLVDNTTVISGSSDNIEYDVCNVYNDDESELCGMRFKHSQSTSTLRRHLLNKHSSLGKIYLIFFDEINLKIY